MEATDFSETLATVNQTTQHHIGEDCIFQICDMVDRGLHSSVLDVESFKGVDHDTDHSVVGVGVREREALIN
jgi:hypothetical protein